MAIDWTPFRAGDAISADSIHSAFSAVGDGVNDIRAGYIQREALTRDHLPSVVVASGKISIGSSYHEYTASDSPYVGTADSAFSSARIINTSGGSGGGTELKLDFNVDGTGYVLAQDEFGSFAGDGKGAGVAGVFVMFNATCLILARGTAATWGTSGYAGYHDIYAVFNIWTKDSTGSYRCVAKAERFIDSETNDNYSINGDDSRYKHSDISIRTLITDNDIFGNKLSTVYVSIGIYSATHTGNVVCRMQQATLSAFALQTGACTEI